MASVTTASGHTPFGGTAAAVPGTIQAENFDEGASGVAYFDTTAGNTGGKYRTTDVDLESTTDVGAGYNVGRTRPGEWLKYLRHGGERRHVRGRRASRQHRHGGPIAYRNRRHRPHRPGERVEHGRLAGLADGEED